MALSRQLKDGTKEYKSIRKDIKIDLERFNLGGAGYTFEELVEIKNDHLGEHDGMPVYIKNGRFGPYIEWGDKTKSIKSIQKSIDKIVLADVLPIILGEGVVSSDNKNILRILTKDLSVRNGKFGPYIFYQRDDMPKPQFLNMKKFDKGFKTCDKEVFLEWIFQIHGVR
jgi:DNA topoisomerase-1